MAARSFRVVGPRQVHHTPDVLCSQLSVKVRGLQRVQRSCQRASESVTVPEGVGEREPQRIKERQRLCQRQCWRQCHLQGSYVERSWSDRIDLNLWQRLSAGNRAPTKLHLWKSAADGVELRWRKLHGWLVAVVNIAFTDNDSTHDTLCIMVDVRTVD